MTARRISTAEAWPGIWQAWDDDLGADCSPCGSGATEAEAVADLMDMLEDEADD
jgi:hypothetical protein